MSSYWRGKGVAAVEKAGFREAMARLGLGLGLGERRKERDLEKEGVCLGRWKRKDRFSRERVFAIVEGFGAPLVPLQPAGTVENVELG